MSKKGPIGKFIEHHFRHFNAAALIDAAQGYNDFLKLRLDLKSLSMAPN